MTNQLDKLDKLRKVASNHEEMIEKKEEKRD